MTKNFNFKKMLLIFFLLPIIIFNSCKESIVEPVQLPEGFGIRKNVKYLTNEEKSDFINAVLLLKTVPSPYDASVNYYDQFVKWHREAFDEIDHGDHQMMKYPAHMGPAFLPWHRQFLLLFEEALSNVSGKKINLPYWDWTDPNSTQIIFDNNFMGPQGEPGNGWAVMQGPFRKDNWVITIFDQDDDIKTPYITRSFGSMPSNPNLPTLQMLNTALSMSNYDVAPFDQSADTTKSFRNFLEGWRGWVYEPDSTGKLILVRKPGHASAMHNAVHLWVGGMIDSVQGITGTMTFNTSPNDPVFFLHHANVDRIWAMWERINGSKYSPVSGAAIGHNLNDIMQPYGSIGLGTTPAKMLSTFANKYLYDFY